MKRIIMVSLAIGSMALLSSCATKDSAQTPEAPGYYAPSTFSPEPSAPNTGVAADGWPMNFNDGTTRYTIFEPQCDSWDGHEMTGRSALAVQPAGRAQPVYGVISFTAITLVDKASRSVTLADFKLISADFPAARNETQNYLVPILIHYSKHAAPMALDRLENSLALPEPPKPERLNNVPPKIIIATQPTVLVYIDGPPAWRPIPGTGLERVINTRMLLLKDPAGLYYLHLFDGYVEASSLDGPWKTASQPPTGADVAEKQAVEGGAVDLMSGSPDTAGGKAPSLHSSPAPEVFVATKPSELIQFSGPAEFAAIPGTDLLYAANTSGNVFKLLTDQKTYALISGRWYRAPSLDGPWQYVPGNQLPRDFANIPSNSPKENVKASVPGTPESEEALIENSIPQSTAVARTGSMPEPPIDGTMQLAAIEGTPLHYVANSATPIIEVNPQSWYACQDGVWYDSSSATGPWAVATSVPAVIYSIPPDSPLHYVTYVQVYGANADQVYEGYTPGYLGTEVGDDGTVVYGTGYYYPPWIGAYWYGPPVTWGWGFDDCWSPYWGWGFGCGFGWGWGWGALGGFGCYPPHPWWGGYCGWHQHWGDQWGNWGQGNFAHTGADFYHHDGRFGAGGFRGNFHHAGFNRYGQAGSARTGQLARWQQGQVQSFGRNAWSQPRPGWSSGGRFGSFNGNVPARSYGWGGAGRTVAPAGVRSWAAPGQPWHNRGSQSQNFYSPRYGGMNQSYFNGGARAGNNFGSAPRAGGWSHGMGGSFHGGGGGFHGGGGGSHSGGLGGGGGGGGHGGGGHGGGGGGHGR